MRHDGRVPTVTEGSCQPAESDHARRRTVVRVAVLVAVAYVAFPVLVFTVWVTLANLLTGDWVGLGIFALFAGTGVAAALVGVRGWRHHAGFGIAPLLPLLAWGLATYLLGWLFPVIL